jgi:hypothetical protein
MVLERDWVGRSQWCADEPGWFWSTVGNDFSHPSRNDSKVRGLSSPNEMSDLSLTQPPPLLRQPGADAIKDEKTFKGDF